MPSHRYRGKSKAAVQEKVLSRQKADSLCVLNTRPDINLNTRKLDLMAAQERENPETVTDAFRAARYFKANWFVDQVLLLKSAFFTSGLQFVAANPKKKKALEAALFTDGQPTKLQLDLLQFVNSVVDEYLLMDNVVSFWREQDEKVVAPPYPLKIEDCKYSDAMGLQRMKVRLNYKPEDLEGLGFSPAEIKRYTTGEITLDESKGEFFQVLTRGQRGYGFCFPRLKTVFRTLSQNESMEVGESLLALAGRTVIRQHRIGFEVRSAANASRQAEYLYKQKRADGIQKFFEGATGFVETVSQFDHNIGYIWIDPKLYEGKKWETIIQRLLWWGGPIGFMLLSKSVSPFLLGMLEQEINSDRLRRVGPHLDYVINQAFDLPTPVRVKWSNQCFKDSRLAWDMVKFLIQQGPLSLTTGLEQANFDPVEEAERKKDEASSKRDPELLPKFDPNHGKRPGDNPGRKTGSKDGEAV